MTDPVVARMAARQTESELWKVSVAAQQAIHRVAAEDALVKAAEGNYQPEIAVQADVLVDAVIPYVREMIEAEDMTPRVLAIIGKHLRWPRGTYDQIQHLLAQQQVVIVKKGNRT